MDVLGDCFKVANLRASVWSTASLDPEPDDISLLLLLLEHEQVLVSRYFRDLPPLQTAYFQSKKRYPQLCYSRWTRNRPEPGKTHSYKAIESHALLTPSFFYTWSDVRGSNSDS
jgi:hypothetical protein